MQAAASVDATAAVASVTANFTSGGSATGSSHSATATTTRWWVR